MASTESRGINTQIEKPLDDFESYKPSEIIHDRDLVRQVLANTDPKKIWTEVCDDGGVLIVPGVRVINRMGIYVTELARSTQEEECTVFFREDEPEEYVA